MPWQYAQTKQPVMTPRKKDQRNTYEEVTADASNVSVDEIKG